jgi:Leucine-rich repeat (LRR) protein
LERKKENIVKLDISHEGLEDNLRLEDFSGLNELNCSYNSLTKLEIVNCPKLETLYCNNNQLIELKFQDCPNLKRIYCE